MTMSIEHTNSRRRNAGGHVACLRHGWDQVIPFRGEKHCRTTDLVQSIPHVVLPEEFEPADVAGFRRLPCQREKALHVIAVGVL